jgi:hypothetical protein
MSVQFDAERKEYVVRWRQGGRHRKRRFKDRAEAFAFERTVTAVAVTPKGTAGLSEMEPRLAELEAKLPAVQDTGPGGGGVYAYPTKHGRRRYFEYLEACPNYRQADGSSSKKRGFTSRRAAVQAQQTLDESVRRGEVKISRDTLAQ